VEGSRLAYEYCDLKKIPYNRCGKLIVAVENAELPELKKLYKRATENSVPGVSFLNQDELREVEPYCRGLAAVKCETTGIVDWGQV
jgi:2-hydroxyglutarate dehydrogenase